MTCKGRGRVIKLARAMQYLINTELSSHEETRFEFNRSTGAIKSAEGGIRPVCGLGIDVHQDFYVVVEQVGGTNPKSAAAIWETRVPALGSPAQGEERRRASARGL
jgi:hypothetical protein